MCKVQAMNELLILKCIWFKVTWIWIKDDGISVCVSVINNFSCITNFPSHDLAMQIMWKSFINGFAHFAYRCYVFKTQMMHV
jgi:hypothetical protein